MKLLFLYSLTNLCILWFLLTKLKLQSKMLLEITFLGYFAYIFIILSICLYICLYITYIFYINIYIFFFLLSPKFLFHDFERLQLKYLFFGIPAPFLLSLEFYFGISVLLLISGIPPFLVRFSPSRISPLVWSFPLRREWIPNMEIVPAETPRIIVYSPPLIRIRLEFQNDNRGIIETETILRKTAIE